MSEEPAEWTIDRLARLAAAALAAGALAPQPNGRIREVPDVRTIRYYTSIGLLDRPASMRARTALYGRRHLAQLVAIKRLQAAGLTLTEVQQRLLGADAAAVERIAMLPEDVGELEARDAADVSGAAAAPFDTPPSDTELSNGDSDTDVLADTTPANDTANGTTPGSRQRFWSARPTPTPLPVVPPTPSTLPTPPLVNGIGLAPDVILLLTADSGHLPNSTERAAIAEAARPLLDLLRRLGLSEA